MGKGARRRSAVHERWRRGWQHYRRDKFPDGKLHDESIVMQNPMSSDPVHMPEQLLSNIQRYESNPRLDTMHAKLRYQFERLLELLCRWRPSITASAAFAAIVPFGPAATVLATDTATPVVGFALIVPLLALRTASGGVVEVAHKGHDAIGCMV